MVTLSLACRISSSRKGVAGIIIPYEIKSRSTVMRMYVLEAFLFILAVKEIPLYCLKDLHDI
jgi:hypothetical protein